MGTGSRVKALIREVHVKDLWTHSAEYRRALQSDEQLAEVVRLLELDAASSLVDVGCGNGAFAIEAARKYPNCRVTACDVLESAVAQCRKAGADLRNLEVLQVGADAIPLPGRSVERILIRNVLHHLSDPRAALVGVIRLLKPGGLFLLEGPCNGWDEGLARLLSEIHRPMDDSHPRTYLTPLRLQAVFEEQGLTIALAQGWPFPFRVGPEQVRIINAAGAEDVMGLHIRGGRSYIQMQIARLISRAGRL